MDKTPLVPTLGTNRLTARITRSKLFCLLGQNQISRGEKDWIPDEILMFLNKEIKLEKSIVVQQKF
jgi:hypothetical protein